MKKLSSPKTACVHAGMSSRQRLPSIDLSTITPLSNLDEAIQAISLLNAGKQSPQNGIYSRLHNDTVGHFENALAELEGAETSVAFASGMAAITALILDANQRGGHILACRPIYGGTDALLSGGLLGANIQWVEPDEIEKNIRPDTALVMIETPANPLCTLTDIQNVVSQAGSIPVSVDATFATPYLQNPLSLGAAFSVHSATKFIGGHSDVLAGVIACSESHAQRLRKIRLMTGANLHPLSAYMLQRGLQTLHLRIEAAQKNAQILAQRLAEHPLVQKVYYPSEADVLIGPKAQQRGTGCLLAFEVRGGFEAAQRLMQALQCIVPAVSLGSVESLIQHPAGLTHRNVSPEARQKSGISDALLRFSVGIEGVEDLWQDLEQALRAATSARS